EEKLTESVNRKSALFVSLLKHHRILSVRASGLLIAVAFSSFEENKKIIDACINRGVFTDWFLFASDCMRIAPPLTISDEDIINSCNVILECCDLAVD